MVDDRVALEAGEGLLGFDLVEIEGLAAPRREKTALI